MEVLRSLAPTGSPLSVGSPLVWFIFVACAVLQLPLIMDVCSQLFGVNRLVHNVVSKILIVLMTICGCLSVYMFHTIFLPRWQQATGSPLVGLTLFATWLFVNSSYRFSRAIMTDPGDGYAPVSTTTDKDEARLNGGQRGRHGQGSAAVLRTCKKCDRQKAPFAHHCGVWCVQGGNFLCLSPRRHSRLIYVQCPTSSCGADEAFMMRASARCSGRCVSYMDHHCPFTHNCVGRANFVHYYLFLVWTTVGGALASYLSLPVFLNCVM